MYSIPESVETDHPTTRFWKKPGPRRRPLESFSSFVFHPSTYRTVEIVLKEDLTRNYCILRSSTTTIAVYSSSSWFFSVLLRTSVPNIESNSQLNWQVHEGGRSALLPSCTLQAKLALQQKGKNSFLQFPLFTTVYQSFFFFVRKLKKRLSNLFLLLFSPLLRHHAFASLFQHFFWSSLQPRKKWSSSSRV